MASLIRYRPLRVSLARACFTTTVAVGVAVAVTLPAAARAQESALPLPNATPYESPTYPGWIFTPTLASGGTWDDNLLLLDPTEAALRDYATPVQPSLRLEYRGRRTLWSGSYDSSFLFYRDVTELNSSSQAVDIRFRHNITRSLALSGHESFAQVPTTDAFALGGVPFYRIGARTNDLGARLDAKLTRTTQLVLDYTLTSVDFESARLLDVPMVGGYSHQGSVSLDRQLSRQFTVGARYQLQQAVLADGGDRVATQNASITGQYQVTPTTVLSGFAGVAHLGAGLQHGERTGPTFGMSVSRRLTKAISASLGYQRTFIPSWAFGGTFQNEELFASIRVPFARNQAYVEGRGTWLDADALDARQPSLRSLWVGTVIGYRVTRWISLEGFYDRTGQNTNQAGGDRHRNMLGFRIVTSKPMKLS